MENHTTITIQKDDVSYLELIRDVDFNGCEGVPYRSLLITAVEDWAERNGVDLDEYVH